MKAVILAGGLGSRLSEETDTKPKPIINIGDKPILWHIMKIYSRHGINEFIICLGYKGYVIKEYFANYYLHTSNVTFDLQNNSMHTHHNHSEPWKVTLVDTGEHTMTGGRIKRIQSYVGDDTFLLTYGDGLADVDISASIDFHKQKGRFATVTTAQPPGRFGAVNIDAEGHILKFQEKPQGDGRWINAGFFVLEPEIFDFIENDQSIWEQEPLINLAKSGQLCGYKHHGFWQPMDTLRDKNYLETLWKDNQAPWMQTLSYAQI